MYWISILKILGIKRPAIYNERSVYPLKCVLIKVYLFVGLKCFVISLKRIKEH